ncbi:PIG-L family deacetylase [Luteimonas sp. RD2P54]|uniref:PIG-L family deacetylase n=1 Tax=Luteimonas endophytica TaxID=3042023 RepID=A0ABT6JB82_9GAMM|nr:PIG-L family deacetylase [Luteimonas endophytica]MDH5824081.1 PIG-L family deacetylase [Luteimonas endophytica]
MDAVARPRIHGRGTSESAWRRSPWLAALRREGADDWLSGASRLVVVSPHPDDEALGCGGLIAHARAASIEVSIVAATDGEACYPGDPRWSPARLRRVRRAELARAAAALGVGAGDIRHLDLGDGRLAGREDALCRALLPLLGRGDRVLTTWSGDGHPDHEATARAVRFATARCGARMGEFPVWAWHWMDPHATPALPRRQARRLRLSGAARRAKAAALACFASQTGTGELRTAEPVLPPHVLARFARSFEVVLG